MLIAVSTENIVKLEAVRQAFENAGFEDFTVKGFNVPSGIPEQPDGEEETQLGAKNRAEKTLALCADADIVIGIESGLFVGNFDVAIVYCLTNHDHFEEAVLSQSEKVKFRDDCVDEARKRGFETTTVGQVMQERGVVINNKDPHLCLKGISRTVYLTQAVEALAADLKSSRFCRPTYS